MIKLLDKNLEKDLEKDFVKNNSRFCESRMEIDRSKLKKKRRKAQ